VSRHNEVPVKQVVPPVPGITPNLPLVIEAVLWDFGGVILSSPFDAFALYEQEIGLPEGFIRKVNSTNADANAWAQFERSEVDAAGFCLLFEQEADALGQKVSGERILACLHGDLRPEMVEGIRRVKAAGLKTACLTNNVLGGGEGPEDRRHHVEEVMGLFDVVVESSKLGVRKPEVRFYEIACELLDVEPSQCVFLDDLGVNLKPAKAMGMTTIKVLNADQALADLEAVLDLPLR
jgi:putative hydrolase of the HAD superfamily